MPRAFLLTHRRYPPVSKDVKSEDEEDDSLHQPQEIVSRAEEFFNLTQLAEVSLAAAQIEVNATTKEVSLKIASNLGKENRELFQCHECGKKYTTSSNLARHRQVHRDINDKKAKKCPQCGKTYVSVPAYSMHIRTHNQDCRCHVCGKGFSRPWLLQGHIRTHTGEKPFKCSICDKAFADRSNLRAHVQTHSNKKPHVCHRCGKAFALKSYLYKHEEASCVRVASHLLGHETSELSGPIAFDAAGRQLAYQHHPSERVMIGVEPSPGDSQETLSYYSTHRGPHSPADPLALRVRDSLKEERPLPPSSPSLERDMHNAVRQLSLDSSGPTDFSIKGRRMYSPVDQIETESSDPPQTAFEPIITVATMPLMKPNI